MCVRTGTAMQKDVEIVAGAAGILAEVSLLVSLVNGNLHVGRFVVELSSDVDVGGAGAHGSSGHQTAFDELVGIVTQDLAILARARFTLVGVDDQIARTTVRRFVHETPFQTAGETGTSATSQS